MKMNQLSLEYQKSSEALKARIMELRELEAKMECSRDLALLRQRIRALERMNREARELAVLMRRYYDRGYYRNGKYTF